MDIYTRDILISAMRFKFIIRFACIFIQEKVVSYMYVYIA